MESSVPERLAQRRLAAFAVAALLFVSAPLLGWMILAIWVADLSRPRFDRLAKAFGGHGRAAGLITVLLVVAVVAPVSAVLFTVGERAIDFAKSTLAQGSVEDTLRSVAVEGGDTTPGVAKAVELLRSHTEEAGAAALRVLAMTAAGLFGLFVFAITLFGAYVDAPAVSAFLMRISPLGPEPTRRMALAFRETGRGLFVGIGLTCVAQGLLATLGYAVAGVPRFLLLGVLTMFGALIPGVGIALVWIPVVAGLVLAHRTNAAIGIAVYHVLIVGMADNILRPVFAKLGKLDMSGATLMLAILGGISIFGAWGLVFGPLLVRLTVEALRIVADAKAKDAAASE